MRMKLLFVAASAVMLGWIAPLDPAAAANAESISSIRGSLGASLADLSLDNSFGMTAFAINATFALICVAVARLLARRMPRQSGSTRHIAMPWLLRRAC